MAQTMLLMSSVSASYSVDLKRDSLLQLQSQRLRPKFSYLSFNPLPSTSFSSSRTFTTLAVFKSKTKAAPSKVLNFVSILEVPFIIFFGTLTLVPRDLCRL